MLGEPFIKDDNLRVEVYRVLKASNFYVPAVMIPEWDEIIAYALVVYDKEFVVKHIDWDFYISSPYPIKHLIKPATLLADDFYFETFVWEGGDIRVRS